MVIVIKGYLGWHRRLLVIGWTLLFTIWIMITMMSLLPSRAATTPAARYNKLLSLITRSLFCHDYPSTAVRVLFKREYGFVILLAAKWNWQYFMCWHLICKSGRGLHLHFMTPSPSLIHLHTLLCFLYAEWRWHLWIRLGLEGEQRKKAMNASARVTCF